MTSVDLRTLLEATNGVLQREQARYRQIEKSTAHFDTLRSRVAGFLAGREHETISSIESYLDVDEHDAALNVHVRLGGFPFEVDEEPANMDLSVLVDATLLLDAQLEQLCKRIELQAVSDELRETLGSLRTIIHSRRQRLCTVLDELEDIALACT